MPSREEAIRFFRSLPASVQLEMTNNPVEAREALEGWMVERVKSIFVVHVNDKDALPHEKDFVANIRERNRNEHPDYQGPNLWDVREGMNFLLHGPKLSVPLCDWRSLDDGGRQNYESTEACRVLWTPRIVEGSKYKTPYEMKDVLEADYKKWGLPALRRSRPFGSVSLVTGLIAAHYKRTSGAGCVPLNYGYAATDTRHWYKGHLVLGFMGGSCLRCVQWDGTQDGLVGCFPLVVLPSAA